MRVITGALALLLAACGDTAIAPPALTAAQKDLYAASCAACHSTEAIGVPQLGDAGAWQERLNARGLDGLIASTINGIGGMPPYGSCPACTENDLEALTRYLITGQSEAGENP